MNEPPILSAVVAIASNRVIGREGGTPWSLSTDLKRYRSLTMGKPMIMGRKTLEAIGRVLDGRDSIVLTRGSELPFEGAHRVGSPDEALSLATRLAAGRGAQEIVVAGGAQIYRLFIDRVDRLYVTHVDAEPEGDALFPEIERRDWASVSSQAVPAGPKDSADSRFVIYSRLR